MKSTEEAPSVWTLMFGSGFSVQQGVRLQSQLRFSLRALCCLRILSQIPCPHVSLSRG